MGCPSLDEKRRIFGLKNWKFESFHILADDWIPDAGRSNVLAQRRMCWIQVFGIPLHLRSKELFKAIGDICGNFLEFDVSNWFKDGVRLKIFVNNTIPDEVTIRYNNHLFSVLVVTEPLPPASRKCRVDKQNPDGRVSISQKLNLPNTILPSSNMVVLSSLGHAGDSVGLGNCMGIEEAHNSRSINYPSEANCLMDVADFTTCSEVPIFNLNDKCKLIGPDSLYVPNQVSAEVGCIKEKVAIVPSLTEQKALVYEGLVSNSEGKDLELSVLTKIKESGLLDEGLKDSFDKNQGIKLVVDLTSTEENFAPKEVFDVSQKAQSEDDFEVEVSDSETCEDSASDSEEAEEPDDDVGIDQIVQVSYNLEEEFISAIEIDITRRAVDFGNLIGLKSCDPEVESLNLVKNTVKETFETRIAKVKTSKLEREMKRLNWDANSKSAKRDGRCSSSKAFI
ncbi:hypothetical protein LINGRAHAP2_LOCUS7110 [Linum grandiflorum]